MGSTVTGNAVINASGQRRRSLQHVPGSTVSLINDIIWNNTANSSNDVASWL